jgi:preprotein translocase subunit YajC
VKSVQDDEVRVELAPNVDVRVVRGTIAEVRGKTEPAPANDSNVG